MKLMTITSSIVSGIVAIGSTLLTETVQAVECGKWSTNECFGKHDRRYDPTFTNNLAELAPIWQKWAGLYKYEIKSFTGAGDPLPSSFFDPASQQGAPHAMALFYGFQNISVDGSRFREHRYHIHPPADAAFCAQEVPEGLTNAKGDAICGVNGGSQYGEVFGVSSYEKDGSALTLPWTADDNFGNQGSFDGVGNSFAYPVDNYTIHFSTKSAASSTLSETFVASDLDFNSSVSTMDLYVDNPDGTNVLAAFFRFYYTKVETEDEWLALIEAAYEEHNVPMENRVQGGILPMSGTCLADSCPTEDDWCQFDPACSESIYQEPEGSVKAGVIAGFTVAAAALIILALYAVHRHQMAQQAKRNQAHFARRIAKTISLRASTNQLSPDALVREFKRIDVGLDQGSDTGGDGGTATGGGGGGGGGDGFISRDELWEFLATGQAGEISNADFKALFAAMDVNNDGKVNFVEFCTYLSGCEEEFHAAANEHRTHALTRQDKLVQSARRLSSLAMTSAPEP